MSQIMLKERQNSSPQVTLSAIMRPMQNDLEVYGAHLRLPGRGCVRLLRRGDV